MLTVETIRKIRCAYERDKKSIRQIVRDLNLARNTFKKMHGKTKSQCDREFLNGMLETCKKLHSEAYATCVGAAFVYYNAVSWGGGEDFDNARKCCQ